MKVRKIYTDAAEFFIEFEPDSNIGYLAKTRLEDEKCSVALYQRRCSPRKKLKWQIEVAAEKQWETKLGVFLLEVKSLKKGLEIISGLPGKLSIKKLGELGFMDLSSDD